MRHDDHGIPAAAPLACGHGTSVTSALLLTPMGEEVAVDLRRCDHTRGRRPAGIRPPIETLPVARRHRHDVAISWPGRAMRSCAVKVRSTLLVHFPPRSRADGDVGDRRPEMPAKTSRTRHTSPSAGRWPTSVCESRIMRCTTSDEDISSPTSEKGHAAAFGIDAVERWPPSTAGLLVSDVRETPASARTTPARHVAKEEHSAINQTAPRSRDGLGRSSRLRPSKPLRHR